MDVVAAFMTRTYPGISDESDGAEWDRVMEEVSRVAPDVLKEMWIPPHQQGPLMKMYNVSEHEGKAILRANGPILSAHMQAFAAKVGFALHFENTNEPVPEDGAVQVRWFTSQEMENENVPKSLYASIGQPQILKQGKITSDGVFEYGAGRYEDDEKVHLYFARFRQSFEVAAFVVNDRQHLPFPEGALATFRPGELQDKPTDRIDDDLEAGENSRSGQRVT